jgi:signal transduction histidine kinase
MYENFLKKIPLFANLPDEDLTLLCGMLSRVELKPGEELFAEGDPGDQAYVIQEGEIEIVKISGGRKVLLAVRRSGEVIGELALLGDRPRMASASARVPSALLAIHQDQLEYLLSHSPTAAEAMFYSILARWRNTDSQLRQSDKMAQLGSLTAGIAHELNNPAAAVKRGAEQLKMAVVDYEEAMAHISRANLDDGQQETLAQLGKLARERAGRPPEMDALARSDREYELEEWLEDQGLEDAWELAPTLVDLDFGDEEMELLVEHFEPPEMAVVIHWLNASFTTYNLFAELKQGAERISGIVHALKTYSYLDQAPVQAVDINQGLNDTLLILNHKLKRDVSVRREFTEDLPQIEGYGSELNQVWTNIIDNAADALRDKSDGQKLITIRTWAENDGVVVEIEDNGAGIPEHVKPKIFEPFYTTKPVGVGTGLGLDISYNIIVNKHRGEIRAESEPGKTVFHIWLPVEVEGAVVRN